MFPLRIVRAMRCFATSTASSRALLSCDSRWLFDGGKGLKACLNAAQQLGITECDALIFTPKSAISNPPSPSTISGLQRLIFASSTKHAQRTAPPCSTLLLSLLSSHYHDKVLPQVENEAFTSSAKQGSYKALLGQSNIFSRDVFPRVAATLGVQPITDIVAIEDERTFVRPMYAGSILANVQLTNSGELKILTIRPASFSESTKRIGAADSPEIIEVDLDKLETGLNCRVDAVAEVTDARPLLTNASVIISGGRALGSKEKFDELLEPLARKLRAAVGATRAACDSEMASGELQVGQTGQIVSPDLYIAIGISGAVQHIAGIKDAKTIIAINKDKDAPIFQMCDYGLVGDLFQIVPELTQKFPQL